MPTATREPVFSYSVMRLIEGLRRPLRDNVLTKLDAIIRAEGTDTIQIDHVTRAIALAADEYLADYGMVIDMTTVARSEADIAAGRYRPIEDVIDEFRRKCA